MKVQMEDLPQLARMMWAGLVPRGPLQGLLDGLEFYVGVLTSEYACIWR